MADWANIANSVATAVSSVTNTISTLGAGDSNAAVRAAKNAGKYAAQLEDKKYPSWDVKGTKDLAKEIGITTRAAWKKARAEAKDKASDEAYKEVMDLYKRQVEARVNVAETQSSQDYQDERLRSAYESEQNKYVSTGGGIGCMVMCVCMSVAGSLVYLVVNYLC